MVETTAVSFIGTGSMGRPLIDKLLTKGYRIQVYDKFKENADPVLSAGAIWQNTPREAAQGSMVVVTCLPLPHHVLENMIGDNGALAGMRPGSTWIDTSTTDYHNTLHIAGLAAKQGIYSLEAPVSNLSHMGADFANVSFYIGGDQEGYQLSRNVIDTMGRISFYVGKIGMGQTVKLFTNLLFYTATAVWGELLIIAKHHSIPLHWMWEFVKKSKGNCFVSDQLTPFILDGSYDRSCTIEITVKDTSLTVALADELGVALPIGRIIEKRYRQAGERYDAHDNHVKVVQLAEEDNRTRLQIEGFTAPSPYGAASDYRHPSGLIEDEYGRIKPMLPDRYHWRHPDPDARSLDTAQALTDFLAYVNHSILHESYMLGRGMGLDEPLLRQVVRWSCGPSWVADHELTFRPDPYCLGRVAKLGDGLILPVIHQLLDVLASRDR